MQRRRLRGSGGVAAGPARRRAGGRRDPAPSRHRWPPAHFSTGQRNPRRRGGRARPAPRRRARRSVAPARHARSDRPGRARRLPRRRRGRRHRAGSQAARHLEVRPHDDVRCRASDGRRFGHIQLSSLCWQDIEEMVRVTRIGRSVERVRRSGTVLSRALNRARKRGLIEHNPAKDAARPKAVRRKPESPQLATSARSSRKSRRSTRRWPTRGLSWLAPVCASASSSD
jgi:hypothetical protein